MPIDKNTLWNISSSCGRQQFICKCTQVIDCNDTHHVLLKLFYRTRCLNATSLIESIGHDITSDHRVSSRNVVVIYERLQVLLNKLETADLEASESFSLDLSIPTYDPFWIGISDVEGYVKEPGKPFCTVLGGICNYKFEMVFRVDEGIVRSWGKQLENWLKHMEGLSKF